MSEVRLAANIAMRFSCRNGGRVGWWQEHWGQAYLDVLHYGSTYHGDSFPGFAKTYLPQKLGWRYLRERTWRRVGGKWVVAETSGLRGVARRRASYCAPRDERIDAAVDAMRDLPDDQWEALMLHCRGLSVSQLQAVTQRSESVVGQRKRLAVTAVRERVGGTTAPRPHRPQSGITGIYWDEWTKQWRVAVRVDGKERRGGRYDTLEEAKVGLAILRNLVGEEHGER